MVRFSNLAHAKSQGTCVCMCVDVCIIYIHIYINSSYICIKCVCVRKLIMRENSVIAVCQHHRSEARQDGTVAGGRQGGEEETQL